MAARAISSEFKSPKHKLIAFFLSARDKWRERAFSYRKVVRSLNVTARDLRKSRDGWRQKYFQMRKRCMDLEAQLEHPPPRTDNPAQLTSAAVIGHH